MLDRILSLAAWVVVGFILLPLVSIAGLILMIMAGIAANKGEAYRYPFAIRLVK